jgi:hypothetical protein
MGMHLQEENSNHLSSSKKRALRHYYTWRKKDRAE